jgi:hypothetical protein
LAKLLPRLAAQSLFQRIGTRTFLTARALQLFSFFLYHQYSNPWNKQQHLPIMLAAAALLSPHVLHAQVQTSALNMLLLQTHRVQPGKSQAAPRLQAVRKVREMKHATSHLAMQCTSLINMTTSSYLCSRLPASHLYTIHFQLYVSRFNSTAQLHVLCYPCVTEAQHCLSAVLVQVPSTEAAILLDSGLRYLDVRCALRKLSKPSN